MRSNKAFEHGFVNVINNLISKYASSQPYEEAIYSDLLEAVKHYMLDNLYKKITIDELAKISGKSKFKFLR